MTASLEALYIFDNLRTCVLEHHYNARPPSSSALQQALNAQPTPHASICYLTSLNPPTTAFCLNCPSNSNLTLVATQSRDVSPLAILEFLRRFCDILEEFLGSPLLPQKLEEKYEIVAQILSEVADGGILSNTGINSLQENVKIEGQLDRLLNQVRLPGTSQSTTQPTGIAVLRPNTNLSDGPSVPWRKANVRHTSNELYLDILETVHVILSPSGRPISAYSNGTIAMTSKISGVPEIILSLSAPGGGSNVKASGINRVMSLPTFHPSVRLQHWKSRPGELSFIPPDGRFILAGYQCDLLPYSFTDVDNPPPSHGAADKLFLPAVVDLQTGLGVEGRDFEARLMIRTDFPGGGTASHHKISSGNTFPGSGVHGPGLSRLGTGFGGSQQGTTGAPSLEGISVHISFPKGIGNVLDLRSSRGDAKFDMSSKSIEWKIPTTGKEASGSISGIATLRGSVSTGTNGTVGEDDENLDPTVEEYYGAEQTNGNDVTSNIRKSKTVKNKNIFPHSISTSFTIRGWLPSGIKVEALNIDTRRSRGLGEGVKPYKGVKYVTVSRNGVERRT